MIDCHDSRGKVIVFFLLVISLGLGISCNFEDDPISGDYIKKIKKLEEYLPLNYQVTMPKVISKEKEDQNCFHLLMLFLSNSTLANIERRPGSQLDKMIVDLQTEIHFLEQCSFKIPSTCLNESVSISTVLENLSAHLAVLKPNIENSFTHCLRVTCVTAFQNASIITSTIATTRHNKSQQDSTVDVLSKEHATPTVNINDSSLDHLGGDRVKQSNGTRSHLAIIPICIILGFMALVKWKKIKT